MRFVLTLVYNTVLIASLYQSGGHALNFTRLNNLLQSSNENRQEV